MTEIPERGKGTKTATYSSPIANKSWIELVEEEEERKKEIENLTESNPDTKIGIEKIKIEYSPGIRESNKRNRSEDRELLIKEEKSKSPLKRRFSDNSDYSERSQQSIENDGRTSHKRSRMCGLPSSRDRQESSSSGGSSRVFELETDESVLDRRQKQIDYGKNTIGYDNYLRMVPKTERTKDHPRTPQKHIKYSRRAFDGLIKIWRKQLHEFDKRIK